MEPSLTNIPPLETKHLLTIQNSESLNASVRDTQGSDSKKENSVRRNATRDQINLRTYESFNLFIRNKVFILSMSDTPGWLFSASGCFELSIIKRRHHLSQFHTVAVAPLHFHTASSLNVYHQFANEPIKRHEIHHALVQTNPAKASPIALYSLLITAQRGFLSGLEALPHFAARISAHV